MQYISLIIALVALGVAWQSHTKNKSLKKDLSHLHSRIYSLNQTIQQNNAQTEQDLTALRFDLLKSQGNLSISGDMTIQEVGMAHPQALQVLGGFHIGGCSGCAADDTERLDLTVARSGQPLEPVIIALNKLIAESKNGSNGKVAEEMLKTPNVQLMF